MTGSTNHFPVNWIDGMKINKNHFIDQDKAFSQQIGNAIRVRTHETNYGLLESPGEKQPVNIVMNIENDQKVHIRVIRCKAVTCGGFYIDLGGTETHPMETSSVYPHISGDLSALKENEFFVAVSVNPFKRIPYGDPNPEEEPLRYPYTVPEYKVHLLPAAETASDPGPYELVIGKLSVRNGLVQIDESFIPPCTTVYSHPSLIDLHSKITALLGNMEMLSLSIIQKTLQKDQQHKLASVIGYITENMLMYLNAHMYRFRKIIKHSPPLEMADCIAGLARVIKNSIDSRPSASKEELLNYFVEWFDLNQAQFESLTNDVINLDYDHRDIRPDMEKCYRFVKEMVALYQKLNDLDYIGRIPDRGIIVKEEELKTSTQSKSKSFFGL